jgi:hypothetical protein
MFIFFLKKYFLKKSGCGMPRVWPHVFRGGLRDRILEKGPMCFL